MQGLFVWLNTEALVKLHISYCVSLITKYLDCIVITPTTITNHGQHIIRIDSHVCIYRHGLRNKDQLVRGCPGMQGSKTAEMDDHKPKPKFNKLWDAVTEGCSLWCFEHIRAEYLNARKQGQCLMLKQIPVTSGCRVA